ncbi:hypothetical protein HF289_13715, partial [Acidithiobacillus ferrooxidans]
RGFTPSPSRYVTVSVSKAINISDRTHIIPLGAVITIPERIQQPLLAIAAGVLFLVLSKALVLVVSGGTHRTATAGTPAGAKVAGATIAGMVFAGLSCLMMG